MATVDQCRQALRDLSDLLAANAEDISRQVDFDRTFVCHIRDLDVSFHGRMRNGEIVDLADGADPAAKIRISVGSDDLVALVAGQLNFAAAWASGRLSVRAGFGDLLKMRKLL